jgi:hypothetical protein
MNLRLIVAATLVIVFSTLVLRVRADVPDVDKYFENVRGELLSFYGSEMVSHAGILLGLIVAFPSTGWRALKRLFTKDSSRRAFYLYFFYSFVLVFTILLTLYIVGRVVFWSTLSTRLTDATTAGLGITESNANSSMRALIDYANYGVLNSSGFPGVFATWFNPSSYLNWIHFGLPACFIICFIITCGVSYRRPLQPRREWLWRVLLLAGLLIVVEFLPFLF